MILTLENALANFEQTVRKYSGDIPHYISMPVLRKMNDKIYLASFVYFYDGIIYPWIYTDLESGQVCGYFTNPDMNAFLIENINPVLTEENCKHKNADYITQCSDLLLAVTEDVVKKKIINYKKYQKYLRFMLKSVPEDFASAYISLSFFTENINEVVSTVTWLPNDIENCSRTQKEDRLLSFFANFHSYMLLSKKERRDYKSKPFLHNVNDKNIVYFCQSYDIAKHLANVFGLLMSDGTPLVAKISGEGFMETLHGLRNFGVDMVALGAFNKNHVVSHPAVFSLDDIEPTEDFIPWFDIEFPHFQYCDFRERRTVATKTVTKEDVLNADVLYTIYNPLTESFHIDDKNCAVMCTNIEDAYACATIFGDMDGDVHYIHPIFHSSFGLIFNTLFCYNGYSGISVNPFSNPLTLIEMDVEKLFEKKYDEIRNPKLKFAITKYHQKRNIAYFKEIKERILKGAQTALEECLESSSLLIPVYKEENTYYHPMVHNDVLDIDAIPCFTDGLEYSKMYSNVQYQALVVPGNELKEINPESDFIINPNLKTYWRIKNND